MGNLELRDVFALGAMHALLIKYGEKFPECATTSGGEHAEIARTAYNIAYCMIMERDKDA